MKVVNCNLRFQSCLLRSIRIVLEYYLKPILSSRHVKAHDFGATDTEMTSTFVHSIEKKLTQFKGQHLPWLYSLMQQR